MLNLERFFELDYYLEIGMEYLSKERYHELVAELNYMTDVE